MRIETCLFRPEHLPAIAALQTHMWSGNVATNTNYFRWKYLENPYLRSPLVCLAFAGDELIAMRGAYGAMWENGTGAGPVPVPCADDMVVEPEYRNHGVVKPVMERLFQELETRGFPTLLSLSAAPVTLVAQLASGWHCAGSIDAVVHMSRRARFAQSTPVGARAARRFLVPSRRHLFRRLDAQVGRHSGRVTVTREPRVHQMAAMIAHLPSTGRVRHVRDANYLGWRFRNPLADYRFVYAGDSELDGFVVLRRVASDRGERETIMVADWEGVDAKVRFEVLDAAIRLGNFPRLEAWKATQPEPVRTALDTRGFRKLATRSVSRPGHHVLVRGVGADGHTSLFGRALTNLAAWDMRPLYSMAG